MGYRLYLHDKNKPEEDCICAGKLYGYTNKIGKSLAIKYLSEYSPEMKEEFQIDNFARCFNTIYEYAYELIVTGPCTPIFTLTKDETIEFMKRYCNDFERGFTKEYDKQILSDILNYVNEADIIELQWI